MCVLNPAMEPSASICVLSLTEDWWKITWNWFCDVWKPKNVTVWRARGLVSKKLQIKSIGRHPNWCYSWRKKNTWNWTALHFTIVENWKKLREKRTEKFTVLAGKDKLNDGSEIDEKLSKQHHNEKPSKQPSMDGNLTFFVAKTTSKLPFRLVTKMISKWMKI